MGELTPEQGEADDGRRVFELPPVDGPCWTSDCLAISREWAAFKENAYRASWNMIPYAAVSSVRRGDYGRIVLTRRDGLDVVISAKTLESLQAGTLLAEGLSTNPAVASAASELLRVPLAAARSRHESSLARLHKVNRSGTIHTFHSMRGFHLVTGIVLAVFGAGLVVGQVAAVVDPSSKWAQGDTSAWDFMWGTALGLLFVWVGIRLVRVGVHISSEKMTIRGYFVTRTVKAGEIRAITLQPKDNGQGQLRWIPQVELTSGKSSWIDSFDCGPARNPPKPGLAATIEDVRTLLGVKAPHPGGQPGLTHRYGSDGSPFPQADPASGGAEKGKAPAEASSPPPGSPRQSDNAASKARWATIWLVISLVATAGGTAVFVAGYNPNSDSPTDWTVIFMMLGPLSAWLAWRGRNEYRKMDQARKADEFADARDGTVSPNDDRGQHPATG